MDSRYAVYNILSMKEFFVVIIILIVIVIIDSISIYDTFLQNEYNYSNELDVSYQLFHSIPRKFNATDYFLGIYSNSPLILLISHNIICLYNIIYTSDIFIIYKYIY